MLAVGYAISSQWPVLHNFPELDLRTVHYALEEARRRRYLDTYTNGYQRPVYGTSLIDQILAKRDHGVDILESLYAGLSFHHNFEYYLDYIQRHKPEKTPKQKQYALRSKNARTRSLTRYRTAQ